MRRQYYLVEGLLDSVVKGFESLAIKTKGVLWLKKYSLDEKPGG